MQAVGLLLSLFIIYLIVMCWHNYDELTRKEEEDKIKRNELFKRLQKEK